MMEWLTQGWPLFGASYVAAWALAVALPLAGIPVVAREQALLGAGLVQVGACGFALALACSWSMPGFAAFVAIAAASLLAQRPPARERPEAVAAWMILAGGATTVLLLSHRAQGTEHLSRLTASSVLGASWDQAAVAIAFALIVLAVAAVAGRRLLMLAWEPRVARLQGVRSPVIGALAAVGLALLLAVALRVSGALFTTAVLVMPALIARRLCRSLRWLPLVAVAVALVAVTGGFAIGWSADVPPGQAAVGLLGLALVAAWCWPPSWRN
jgi:zinc transport system permease protein